MEIHFFSKIRQEADGKIYACTVEGNKAPLTRQQLEDLGFTLFVLKKLPGFNVEAYAEGYWDGVYGLYETDRMTNGEMVAVLLESSFDKEYLIKKAFDLPPGTYHIKPIYE